MKQALAYVAILVALFAVLSAIADVWFVVKADKPLTPGESGFVGGFEVGIGVRSIALLATSWMLLAQALPKGGRARARLSAVYFHEKLYSTARPRTAEFKSYSDSDLVELYNSMAAQANADKAAELLAEIKARLES